VKEKIKKGYEVEWITDSKIHIKGAVRLCHWKDFKTKKEAEEFVKKLGEEKYFGKVKIKRFITREDEKEYLTTKYFWVNRDKE